MRLSEKAPNCPKECAFASRMRVMDRRDPSWLPLVFDTRCHGRKCGGLLHPLIQNRRLKTGTGRSRPASLPSITGAPFRVRVDYLTTVQTRGTCSFRFGFHGITRHVFKYRQPHGGIPAGWWIVRWGSCLVDCIYLFSVTGLRDRRARLPGHRSGLSFRCELRIILLASSCHTTVFAAPTPIRRRRWERRYCTRK